MLRLRLAVLLAALLLATTATQAAAAPAKPTVVLVHGAFADASGWNGVIERCRTAATRSSRPANPLRGVSADAHTSRASCDDHGPIVLVGHSYGGAVITNAATGNPNVKALVYIAAYAPDQGDTVASAEQRSASRRRSARPTLDIRRFPTRTARTARRATIKLDVFRDIFAAECRAKRSQRWRSPSGLRPCASLSASHRVRPPGRRSRRGT